MRKLCASRCVAGLVRYDYRGPVNRAASVLMCVVCSCWCLGAQEPTAAFEVASVRPQTQPLSVESFSTAGSRVLPGGVFKSSHVTVLSLVLFAHPGLLETQVRGGPDWIRRDYFQVDARAGGEVSIERMRLMVRALLEERFKLIAHRETREMHYEALVWASSEGRFGPHVQQIDQCTPERITEAVKRAPRRLNGAEALGMSGCLTGGLANLAAGLGSILGTPVFDATGFKDAVFIAMQYASPRAGGGAALSADPSLPPLRIALEEKLGLKLEPRQGPLDILVIDSVERPGENQD